MLGVVGGFRRLDPGEVQLVSLWVDPDARGRGVARSLIRAVATWARDRGAADVVLFVQEANAPGRALYVRAGFRPTGAREPVGAGPPRFQARRLGRGRRAPRRWLAADELHQAGRISAPSPWSDPRRLGDRAAVEDPERRPGTQERGRDSPRRTCRVAASNVSKPGNRTLGSTSGVAYAP